MELITRTAKLIPYGRRPRRLAGFVTAYNHEPMADDTAARYGNLFVVIEVLTGGRQSEDTADLIIETFRQHYYDAQYDNDTILTRFEHALKATNHELAGFIGQGNAAWVGKLSAVIAVQRGTELHLAHAGSAEAYLYRGKSSARITAQAAQPSAPSKTFGTVTSGELEDGDRLLLSTPALFHQLPLTKLKSVVSGATPAGAVSEVTQILESAAYAQIDRIAVILVELVSPERAASQTLSAEPSEVLIGAPETPIEAVKYAATPIAQATAQQARSVQVAAQTNWERSKPHVAKAHGLVQSGIARALARPRYLVIAGCVAAGVVVSLGIVYGLSTHKTADASKLVDQYNASYLSYQSEPAGEAASRTDLISVQSQLAGLTTNQRTRLEQALRDTSAAPGAPRRVAQLETAIQERLDELDKLTRVDGKTITRLSSVSDGTSIEINKSTAYVITSGKASTLNVVNLSTGKVEDESSKITALGDVTSSTISYDKRGMYLMTQSSGLWLYDFSSKTVARQTIADTAWESSSAIASYATNIYTLSQAKVYKHTKNLSGYSPKTVYADATTATGLAVDGSVIVGYPNRIDRLSGGAVAGTVKLPAAFTGPSVRLSTDGGAAILTEPQSGRIGLVDLGETLTFKGQYVITGHDTIRDAECDLSVGACYAVTGNELVSFPVSR